MDHQSALISRTQTAMWQGPVGDLEVMTTDPVGKAQGVALLCHPHPLHGGQMHNKVVTTLARAFDQAHYHTVRFNFRGVGNSAGAYDEGRGEQDDCMAMVQAIKAKYGALPWCLAGFSFGAYVAARVAVQCVPSCLYLVAPPVVRLGFEMPTAFDCDAWVFQGRSDEVVASDAVAAWAKSVATPCQFMTFDDCSHFFHGQLVALREAVYRAVVSP